MLFKSLKPLILPLLPSQLSLSAATLSQSLSLLLSSWTLFILCFPQIYAELPMWDKSTRQVGTSSPHPNYIQQDSDTCHSISETVSEKHTWVGATYPFSFLVTLFFRCLYSEYFRSCKRSQQWLSWSPALSQPPAVSIQDKPTRTQLPSDAFVSLLPAGPTSPNCAFL